MSIDHVPARSMGQLRGVVIAATGALLLNVLAADAVAARYASPSGTGDCSSESTSCDVTTAILGASAGEDVYVRGDQGDYSISTGISPSDPVKLHGTHGRPRLIFRSGGLRLTGPSTAESLYVQGPGPATVFALDPPAGGSANNLIVKTTGTGNACYFGGGHILTNSVCWAGSAGDLAAETDGSNTFRNDTFIGGTEAAFLAFARNPDCGCSSATSTLVNVIARSGPTGHDLEAVASDGSADAVINVTHSNFATTIRTGFTDQSHINIDATNQTALPLFVDASGGDFHQAVGSPTIDAGINDAANGATDFDGESRTMNGTTDIGADEATATIPMVPEGLIPGGGPTKSDCYAELAVTGIENPSARVKNNKVVSCTDGEVCDTGPCGDNACNVRIRVCINQSDPNVAACAPPARLDRVTVKARGKVKLDVAVPQLLEGPQCGPFLDGTIPVKVDKKGRVVGAGKAKIKLNAKAPKSAKPRPDEDTVTIQCLPRTVACP